MLNEEKMLHQPIFFKPNRVLREYLGGKLFASFFGDDSEDCYFPEEWLCSRVEAKNDRVVGIRDGVSVIEGTDVFFDDFVSAHKKEMLGDGRETFDVLVKMLDSAIRLPVQAHPDKPFSKQYFHSNFGKTESWLILDTRPDACIFFGFKDKITKEQFQAAVDKALEADNADAASAILEPLLNRIPVKRGDTYLIPSKTIHAIGAGCLLLEVQEPTDFTITPERYCGDNVLSDEKMYIGLSEDEALDCFDYSLFGDAAIAHGALHPTKMNYADGVVKEAIITPADTPCFSLNRYTIENSFLSLPQGPSVILVTDGEGEVICGDMNRKIRKGSYFFLPYCVTDAIIRTDRKIEVAECLPPELTAAK